MSAGQLIVYGAGGHGLVVAEAARETGQWDSITFFDDDLTMSAPEGWQRIDAEAFGRALVSDEHRIIVAIGENHVRQRVSEAVRARGGRLATAIHPTAIVSRSARVGEGVFIAPGAVVHAAARLGEGAIINSGAVVEHHNDIGRFAHVGPGAAMGGRVRVETLALVGVGASVRPDVTIGSGAIVGAGAVVVEDVEDDATVAGVPARLVRSSR